MDDILSSIVFEELKKIYTIETTDTQDYLIIKLRNKADGTLGARATIYSTFIDDLSKIVNVADILSKLTDGGDECNGERI